MANMWTDRALKILAIVICVVIVLITSAIIAVGLIKIFHCKSAIEPIHKVEVVQEVVQEEVVADTATGPIVDLLGEDEMMIRNCEADAAFSMHIRNRELERMGSQWRLAWKRAPERAPEFQMKGKVSVGR